MHVILGIQKISYLNLYTMLLVIRKSECQVLDLFLKSIKVKQVAYLH